MPQLTRQQSATKWGGAVNAIEGDEVLREHLDDEQFDVARLVDRNVLVLAPPGSGKTRVLVHAAAHRARHASELTGYRHARVMCLTFGTDAAREMRVRLERPPLSLPYQSLWVGNYHSLGGYLLHRYGHLIGWQRDAALLPSPANETIVAEAIRDVGVSGVSTSNVASAISDLKGRRRSPGNTDGVLHRIKERYDELFRVRNLRDFDDLILHTLQLLRERPQIAGILHDSYPFVFVDELQDTNLLQLDLLRQIVAPDSRIFGVADDDQMIYGWRDAHPENIDEFVAAFDAVEVPLVGNYRCPPRIVDAANKVIQLNKRRRVELMESRVEDREGEVLLVRANETTEAKTVAAEVARALDEGVPPGEIAILAPHKFKFAEVMEALTQRGIRYVHPGGDELKGLRVARLIQLSLRCVAGGVLGPEDARDLTADANTSEVVAKIQAASTRAAAGSARGLLNRLLGEFKLGTVRNPVLEKEAIETIAAMFRKAIDGDSPNSAAELASVLLLNWERLEAAALRAEQAVKLMTSFTAKGTEYEVVILPFMERALVPYAKKGSEIDWQEARRVFYVGLTRAKSRVVLVRNARAEPSQLLVAIEAEITKSYDRRG